MIGCGMLMALLGLIGWFLARRGRLEESSRFLKFAVPATALPFVASSAGWVFTEMGSQPWVVFGLLNTQDGVSPTVSSAEVWISLVGFTLLYGVLAVFAGKVFFRLAGEGPKVEEEEDPDEPYVGMAY